MHRPTALARPFASRPWLIGLVLLAAIAIGSVGWYLASPLFIRTTADESLAGVTATLARGELNAVDAVHYGRGEVRVVTASGQRLVRFERVAIANGPDLHVYLAPQTGGRFDSASALYLGPLKATDGSFNYELPAAMDVSMYRSVVVWCRNFNVLFTWADLSR